MVITLIGYRGSGKTTVARHLASRLGMPWIDSDDLIEQRAGCSIQDIFARDGEAGFRRMESDVIRELTGRESLVLATGGGAVLSETNRQRLKQAGPVVWLQASVQNLVARIGQDSRTAGRRPSLTGRSVTEEVSAVLESRRKFYEDAATFTVSTDGRSTEDVAEQICRLLEQEPRR